ncbi:MAG: DUF1992 domain-containing protein [Deltaproteobacteria bacterium]|jgi:hypothetical protein|nr:DUF1992 domain-containing protein [Deltaproteobacteria bacterium]
MDSLKIDPVAIIAERKILEAMEQGLFDDLPGSGKPLPEDEFANLPDAVRLCARILKSSSHLEGREAGLAPLAVAGLLEAGPDGAREAFRGIERLSLRLREPASGRPSGRQGRPGSPRAGRLLDSPYLSRILARLF